MKQKSTERPPQVAVAAGIKKYYLTVNVCIREVEDGYEYLTHSTTLDHYPEQADITAAAHAAIDEDTDEKILSGFVWSGIHVWLSAENQRNFSEGQRSATITNGQSLPTTFKLGQDEEGKPVYHEFTTVEELTGFYLQAVAYINQCLVDGWKKKDAIANQEEEA